MPPKSKSAVVDIDADSGPEWSEEARMEMVVLGCMMVDPDSIFYVIEKLTTLDFMLASHRSIYGAVLGLIEDGEKVDYLTVCEELACRNELDSVGSRSYVASLTEKLPRRLNIESYVKTIRKHAQKRRLGAILSRTFQQTQEKGVEADEVIASLQNELIDAVSEGQTEATLAGDVTDEIEKDIEEKRHLSAEKDALGLTWGVEALDAFTKGAFDGEITVLSAESGGGKTLVALQMLIENAKEGTPVAYFSLEMAKAKLVRRMYPQLGDKITSDLMRDPRLVNEHTHKPELKKISKQIRELPLIVDESVSLDINTLCARIRSMRRKHGTRLFAIDYLQLIVNEQKTEAESIKDSMFRLRDLVKLEPTIHILLLSQYSKADGFSKKGRRSRNDLMGSSAIHHAAQNVLLLSIESEEGKDKADLLDTEFRFDKQRDGKKGRVTCYFDRAHLRFRYAKPIIPF